MANGNMVGCHEYYTSIGETAVASRYSGNAGTTTNPYAVEDVFDLQKVYNRTGGGNNASFVLVKDVDYNDHPIKKYGISSGYLWGDVSTNYPYTFSGKDPLTGENHEIRNLIVLSNTVTCGLGTSAQNSKIKNINFVNMILKDTTYNSNSSYYLWNKVPISNCNFSIMFINSSFGQFFGYSCNFTDCSFNIYGTNYVGSDVRTTYLFIGNSNTVLTRCHFNFNNFIITRIGSPTSYIFVGQQENAPTPVKDCYFTGTIFIKNSSNYNVDIAWAVSLYSSYIALTFSGEGGLGNIIMTTNAESISFIDTDILGTTITSGAGGANLAKLTTAQAKSYSYVSGIGFPVILAGD